MDILPFGCRVYAVKPAASIRKTQIEPHAWVGINLGREPDTPGAYNVWIPDVGRKVVTSEAYFDEGLMPWRPQGDQRIGPETPFEQSTTSPSPAASLSGPATSPRDSPADEPNLDPPKSLPEAFDAAVHGPLARARSSRSILLLFSGPKRRPDGLTAFLHRLGFTVVALDADPEFGGGEADNLLNDQLYSSLLARVKASEFLAIIAAPPCSTFSISRFIKAQDGRGAPRVRSRKHIRGLPDVSPKHRRELRNANDLVTRTVALLAAAQLVGTQWMLENPADRGDPNERHLWLHDDHGPLWLMPEILALRKTSKASLVTFPMCAFSAPWQKYTSLLYSAGFDVWMDPLRLLKCNHSSHKMAAGGLDDDGNWASGPAAAYPADFNYYLARAVSNLTNSSTPYSPLEGSPSTLIRDSATPREDNVETRAAELKLPSPRAAGAPDADSSLAGGVPVVAPVDRAPSGKRLVFNDDDSLFSPTVAPSPSAEDATKPKKVYFQRGLGKHSLRNRPPNSFKALHAKPSYDDPNNRKEALNQDHEGWTASERKEIANHLKNKTFEIIDRSQMPTGRKLVRWTWVYKWKRDGTQKSRLCVQGCSMIPGVDFNQTFCATMRSTSLRILGALAAQFGLHMRRWDFTAAYLQGVLEEGEVVYCSMPPGYDVKGEDGASRVCKVIKPCYGMAQAGRRWQRTLFPWLLEWHDASFTQTYGDSCLFYCCREIETPSGKRVERLIVGVYVDDLCILYSHSDEHSLYHKFTTDLKQRWAVEDEGDVSDLLGIDIAVSGGNVCLTQANYINRLAGEFFPEGAPPSIQKNTVPSLPDLPQLVLEAIDSESEVAPALLQRYQSLVGALLYCATNTRPDIAFSVGMLCRAMSRPTPALLAAAERVLAYLIRNKHIGLKYAASERPLFGMTDSDWSVRHSTHFGLAVYVIIGSHLVGVEAASVHRFVQL